MNYTQNRKLIQFDEQDQKDRELLERIRQRGRLRKQARNKEEKKERNRRLYHRGKELTRVLDDDTMIFDQDDVAKFCDFLLTLQPIRKYLEEAMDIQHSASAPKPEISVPTPFEEDAEDDLEY